MSDPNPSPGIIDVGEPVNLDRRAFLVALALGAALFLLWCAHDPDLGAMDRIGFLILGVLLVLAAPFAPVHTVLQLDLGRREVVITLLYGRAALRCRRRPFSQFSGVVLGHTAHEGEGDVQHTADVGLKPLDVGPILWLQTFPATSGGLTAEARAFAQRLAEWTGLPVEPEAAG